MVMRFGCALLLVPALLVSCGGGSGGGGDDAAPTLVKSTYFTATPDGTTIAVHHYQSSNGVKYQEPVLLSAGYMENHKVFHAFPRHSLVEELAHNGWDVWAYDIRGTGESETPEISIGNLFGWDFGVDEFILQDTPTAVNFMRQMTGAAQFHWVAHSMGGTMLYGYLQRQNPALVKSAVTIGGIGYLNNYDEVRGALLDFFYQFGETIAWFIPPDMPVPLKWAFDRLLGEDVWAWTAVVYALDSFLGRAFWNEDSINQNMVYQFLRHGLANTSTNVLKSFLDWAESERCVGDDGWDYTAGLSSIHTPICVMAGGGDMFVPPLACHHVYERVSSRDKQFLACSIDTGHSYDYGHTDILLSSRARDEVYGHVKDFLLGRSVER